MFMCECLNSERYVASSIVDLRQMATGGVCVNLYVCVCIYVYMCVHVCIRV